MKTQRQALKTRLTHVICGVAAASLLASTTAVSHAGDLKLRFEYAGTAAEPTALVVNKDVEFCGKHPVMNERLLVNKDNKGIQNVVLYVYTGRGGSKLDEVPEKKSTHVLENNACRFEPHIVICQTGDTLKVTNPDAVGHNANLPFFKNAAQNFLIPPGQEKSVALEETEPAPIPVECNIHPWMRAYVVVLEHPYVAKSDENGDLVIKDLPEGKELTFRVFHEAGKIDDVKINGKAEKWSRSRFDVTIKAGVNDLGTVVVPADALSAE
ncbi:methylamine utilization protein [Novipirellula sp. SH528]|uniref:methylamine utilization protein n=1 Tax=Novipirellula sp. SH528 TaxID=3454466 RepID=UPI003F9F1FB8